MFSRIGNFLYRSSESKNSGSYVNRQTLNLTLDPSGTDFVEYSTDSAYFTEAHSLIPNPDSQITTTALKLQDSATNNLFLSTLGNFTLCVKHKLNASSTSTDIFSHYFANPQYDISFAEPYIRENSPFNVIVSKASNGPVEYEVSGNLIASDLSNGDISGTISTVESVLPFTLNTGTGGNDFLFLLKNLDVSLNAYIYSQYYVASSTNILGETVFAFSPTGTEGTYNNQLDLSFGANSKMIFNVSDNTMADISLVFGTTVDDSDSINESVVTRTNDLVILDISSGYDGGRLVYFEDSSAGMGYEQPIDAIVKKLYNPPITSAPSPTSSPTAASGTLVDAYYQRQIGADLNDGGEGRWIGTNESDWISLDLTTTKNVLGVLIQPGWHSGWSRPDQYITTLNIHVSTDNTNWTILSNDISSSWNTDITSSDYDPQGNGWTPDSWKMALYFTSTTIYARYVRLYPTSHQGVSRALRFGVIYNSAIGGAVSDTEDLGSHTVVYELPDPTNSTIQVTVSSDPVVFYFDGSAKPPLTFTSGTTYIFDQTHESNANNTLVIGTAPDISSSIVSSGLTIMGTPGQPGAYTKYVADGSTVYYFSYQTENMGEEPLTYTVKVVDHEITGEKVFSFKAPGTSTFINQPDLSFGAGDKYQFDVRDDTMADISLVFGTTVDDISTRNESVVTRVSGYVILDISAGYDGSRLVYFEDTSAGMGYVSSSGSSGTSGTAPQLLNSSFESSSLVGSGDTYQIYYGNTSIDNWTTIGPNSNSNRTFIIREDDTKGFSFPTPFVDGSYCMALGCQKHGDQIETGYLQQIITLPVNNYILSWYDVLRTYPTMVSEPIRIKITKEADSTVIHTHEYLVTNTAWTEKTTSFSITEEANYIVSFESYYIDDDKFAQTAFDKVTFSIAPPPIENYTVDVSNGVFRLDSGDGNGFVEKLPVTFNDNTTYIFDQSHESNANNTLVIGTAFDDPASIVSSGLTIMGTPGQPGAYTKYVSDGTPLYYFSYQNENMGYEKSPQELFHVFSPELETYRIEIRAKRVGDYKPMDINVIKTDTLGNETTTLVDTIAPGTGWNIFNLDFTVEPNVNMIRISIEGQYNYGPINFTTASNNRLIVLDHVKLFHVNDDNTISTTNLLKGYNMDLNSSDQTYLSGTNNNGWDISRSNVVQITSNAIYNTDSDDGNVILLHQLGSLYQDLEIQRNYSYVSATQIYNTDVSFINYNSPVGDFSYTDDATKNFQTGSNVYFTYFGGSIDSTVTYDNANITNNTWTTPSEGNYTVIATKLGNAYYRNVSASTTFTVSAPNITDDLYVHYDFEFPLYDANGTAYSTEFTSGSDAYADQSIRFYNKAYDSITNSDISYNMYVIRGNLVSDTFKVGSSSFKTFESPDKYGASRIGDYSFRLDSTQGYSICFWMKEVAKNNTASQYIPLCALGNSGGGGFFQIEYNDSTFKVNNNGINITYSISSLIITDWNHIAFTMSSDGSTWKLYINESLVNTKTDGTLLTSVGQGNSNYPTDSVFIFDISSKPGLGINNGYIDDFRFYKTELEQAQVSAVYSYTG